MFRRACLRSQPSRVKSKLPPRFLRCDRSVSRQDGYYTHRTRSVRLANCPVASNATPILLTPLPLSSTPFVTRSSNRCRRQRERVESSVHDRSILGSLRDNCTRLNKTTNQKRWRRKNCGSFVRPRETLWDDYSSEEQRTDGSLRFHKSEAQCPVLNIGLLYLRRRLNHPARESNIARCTKIDKKDATSFLEFFFFQRLPTCDTLQISRNAQVEFTLSRMKSLFEENRVKRNFRMELDGNSGKSTPDKFESK